MSSVASFTIEYIQYLDQNSQPTQKLPSLANDTDKLISLYQQMVLLRNFDSKAVALQRTGKMGTYASPLGQEAIGIAIGDAMKPEDVLCPAYREYGAMMQRGVKLAQVLQYWGGDEQGSNFTGDASQDMPICVPIATQCLHGAGIARAFQLRNEKRVAVTVCGDGASSKGDFLEAVHVAGTWKLPMVLVINNNQWAISIPRKIQSGAETLAQKAILGGVRGIQVDGNDIIAMHEVMSDALERARNGEGPTVIEAITYRLCDHTTADDASRYREDSEVDEAWQKEPIKRLREYLNAQGVWDEAKETELQERCSAEANAIAEEYFNQTKPTTADMFDYLYADMPESLQEQRETALVFAEEL